MKKLILTLFFVFTISYSQSQDFVAAIVSTDTLLYDIQRNKYAKILRVIPSKGVQSTATGKVVITLSYALIPMLDTQGNTIYNFLNLNYSDTYNYTNAQIDSFFQAIGNPIFPNESYTNEERNIYNALLLQETMSVNMFGGAEFTIYNTYQD